MKSLVEQLEENLKNLSDEELDEIIESCKKYRNIGPTVEEYIEYVENINNSIYSDKENILL